MHALAMAGSAMKATVFNITLHCIAPPCRLVVTREAIGRICSGVMPCRSFMSLASSTSSLFFLAAVGDELRDGGGMSVVRWCCGRGGEGESEHAALSQPWLRK
eukprot:16450606-Heterocapsa_arctica.AAC.1